LPLGSNQEAKLALTISLHRDFHALKTYGKEPEALDSIIEVMLETLSEFRPDQITKALKIHRQHSAEFPTPADIAGIIRRGGRAPYDRAVYVGISKKDPEDRSDDEWRYMRGYEAEQMDGDIDANPVKQAGLINQIVSLKAQLVEAYRENTKLAELLREARQAKGFEAPKKPIEKKVQDTVDFMRKSGANEEDVLEFLRTMGH
jgi:hypothetical protein